MSYLLVIKYIVSNDILWKLKPRIEISPLLSIQRKGTCLISHTFLSWYKKGHLWCFLYSIQKAVRMVSPTDVASYVLRGVGRLFYIVAPKATTFGHHQEVPDYIAESIPFFVLTIALEFLALVFRHDGKGLRKERLWDASRYSINDMVGSIGVSVNYYFTSQGAKTNWIGGYATANIEILFIQYHTQFVFICVRKLPTGYIGLLQYMGLDSWVFYHWFRLLSLSSCCSRSEFVLGNSCCMYSWFFLVTRLFFSIILSRFIIHQSIIIRLLLYVKACFKYMLPGYLIYQPHSSCLHHFTLYTSNLTPYSNIGNSSFVITTLVCHLTCK